MVGTGLREGNIEDQNGAGFDFGYPGWRLSELHGTVAAHQFPTLFIDEPDSHEMLADFSSPAFHPQDEMGPRMSGRKPGHPDVLKDPEHRELALLVDQGVVRQHREVDLHVLQATRIDVITSFALILLITSTPVVTWPNTVCLPSKCACGE